MAFAQAVLSSEKLSSLDGILVGGKTLQCSMSFRTLQVVKMQLVAKMHLASKMRPLN